jgi:hypothetical protein
VGYPRSTTRPEHGYEAFRREPTRQARLPRHRPRRARLLRPRPARPVIGRDFEAKAPTGTDILARVESGAYESRFPLLRDLAQNLFWVNRFSMTMFDKRPTRFRDLPAPATTCSSRC